MEWTAPSGVAVTLQRSPHADFRDPVIIYQGPDSASTVTGLLDGTYYYRAGIRNPDTASMVWSDVVTLTVAHHSLTKAVAFFVVGLVVFIATSVFVIDAHRRAQLPS